MKKLTKRSINLLLLFFPLLVFGIEDDLVKCSKEENKKKRLNCYDLLAESLKENKKEKQALDLDKPQLIAETNEIPEEESSYEVIQQQKQLITSLKKELKEVKEKKQPVKAAEKQEPFFATIEKVDYINYRFFFTLDNGQRWSTSDTGKAAKLKLGQEVQIIPGAFGASYLKNTKGRFRLRRVR